jgi:hypothetical protein
MFVLPIILMVPTTALNALTGSVARKVVPWQPEIADRDTP